MIPSNLDFTKRSKRDVRISLHRMSLFIFVYIKDYLMVFPTSLQSNLNGVIHNLAAHL